MNIVSPVFRIMRTPVLALLAIILPTQAPANFIFIESFSSPSSSVSVFQTGSSSNTVATAGAIGGYRTLSLTASGDNEFTTSVLGVSSLTSRISLSTPDGNTATNFSIKWAGQDGTGFASPVNLLTLPQGINSELEFSLNSSDQAGTLTWSVTDINDQVSSYALNIPVQSISAPPAFYELRLADFSNPTEFDWTQVKSIEVSGGGIPEWDFSTTGPIVIGVPEPGSFGFVLATLGVIISGRRQKRLPNRLQFKR